MDNKNSIKIFVSVLIILVVGVVATVLIRAHAGPAAPGKYDAFATCMASKGTTFNGAFWCPHCQQQEQWLEASRQTLAKENLYVECSTPDANGQTQVCIDKKVESYPTWMFSNPIKITSADAPTICTKAPGMDGESPTCATARSQYATIYIFPTGFEVSSTAQPTHIGDDWTFALGSQLRGEIPLTELANQTGCMLPQ